MNIRRRRPSQNIDAVVNVTSLIDVTFILLIFFMITTTFAKPNKQLPVGNLPEATNVEDQKNKADIEVLIDEKGNYQINGNSLLNNEYSELLRSLELEKNIKSQSNNDVSVLIKGDANTPYQAVINVMDISRKIDLKPVNLSFEKKASAVTALMRILEQEKSRFTNREPILIIKSNVQAPFQSVANAMDAVEKVGITHLSLATDKRKEK